MQPPAPLELWESDPFEATIRDEWIYARGIADDKGQLWMLLHAAGLLAAEGALPINIRVVSDGEEEVGGQSIVQFLEQDERGADACVIFDGGMESRDLPALSIATRGLAAFNIRVRTGARDLHSGMYGNAALNAIHALATTLGGILPRDGRVPDALRVGIAPVTDEERAGWEQQPAGADVLRDAGAIPYDPAAADEFYLRTTAETSVEVNGILGGKPGLKNTTVVSEAQANFTVRLAPGQDPKVVAPEVERLLHEAAPDGATIEVEELEGSTRPGLVAADSPVIKIAQDAFETRLRGPADPDPLGRHAADHARARGPGHPDDPDRLRAPREQRPLPERADARRVLPARRRHHPGALHPPWRPRLEPSSSRRSRPSSRTTSSSASCATSASTRSRRPASTPRPRPRSSSTSPGCCATSWRRSGSTTSGSTSTATSTARSTASESAPAIGLIAHVDTSPDVTGTGVNPQVHRVYDGGRIELPGDPSVVLDPEELPLLKGKVGHDLVTTDGTTLLGADDKAGVAEIMAAVAYLKRNPGAPHAPIRVCFTVDEEVAGGADHLDLERFGAKFAYTLDGAAPGEIEAETFNAAKVNVTIRGRSTHPGTAKGQLVNAIKLAADFVAALPRDSLSPETTEEREGFVHPTRISGGAEEAMVELIVRDHDAAKMAEHVELLRRLAAEITEREPRASVDVVERGAVPEHVRGDLPPPGGDRGGRGGGAPRRARARAHDHPRRHRRRPPLAARPADAEPLHRRLRVPLPARVGERAGHGRGGGDDRRARPRLGRARCLDQSSQGGGLCTQRPPTIVATTSSSRSSSGSTANGSRSSTTRSAR